MEKQKLAELFLKAEESLLKAENERNRPAFDVVKYAACVHGRVALHHYMQCLYTFYKEKEGAPAEPEATIEDMLAYCKEQNPKLAAVSFESLHCIGKDVLDTSEVYYCNDHQQIGRCASYAHDARNLTIAEIWDGHPPSL